jgi:hypothetical protein
MFQFNARIGDSFVTGLKLFTVKLTSVKLSLPADLFYIVILKKISCPFLKDDFNSYTLPVLHLCLIMTYNVILLENAQ